jgi:hypothetical protein
MAQAKAAKNNSIDVMGKLNYYFGERAPQLPANVKEAIVKFGPWIDAILLLLLAPAILVTLGIGSVALPFSTLNGDTSGLTLTLVALALQVILMVAALPGLFARKTTGWNLAFYGVLFNLVYSVLNFQIVSGLIGAVVSLYFLFQIRSYYK